MVFILVTSSFSDEAGPERRVGDLKWVRIKDVPRLPIPAADAIFFPRIIDGVARPFVAHVTYDSRLMLHAWRHC